MLLYKLDKEKSFYLYACLFVLTGWLWFLWSLYAYGTGVSVCLFHKLTTLPCPACGGTGSVLLLIKGEWFAAFYTNPLGYILAIGLLLAPLWLLADILRKKPTMFRAMARFDEKIRQQPLLILILLLPIIINWIWNIIKM